MRFDISETPSDGLFPYRKITIVTENKTRLAKIRMYTLENIREMFRDFRGGNKSTVTVPIEFLDEDGGKAIIEFEYNFAEDGRAAILTPDETCLYEPGEFTIEKAH